MTGELHEMVWDRLVDHGLPMTRLRAGGGRADANSLMDALAEAVAVLADAGTDPEREPRYAESFGALLAALRNSFPSIYGECRRRIPGLERWLPQRMDGRTIRLKRISEALVSRYL
jgi:hypothetical protein